MLAVKTKTASGSNEGLFGEVSAEIPVGPSMNPVMYGFAGYHYDPFSKQYFMGPRTYDPNTGRWNQMDPIGPRSGDLNNYRYVLNNPLRYTDPTGLYCQKTIDKGIVLVGAGLVVGVVSPPAGAVCGGAGLGLIAYGYFEDCPEPKKEDPKEEPGKKEPENNDPQPKKDDERILG